MGVAERFVLWRVIGNDLPPRHDVGSAHENLTFTLDNEPPLEGVEQRWWLNRLIDDSQLEATTAELDRRGAQYHTDPFDSVRYRAADGRHEKILAAVNINGVRNAILDSPECDGAFVLPFDGGTFFTRAAWSSVRADIEAERTRGTSPECFAVPMVRAARRNDVFATEVPAPTAEPQIVFSPGCTHRFDERYPYGFRDKVSLLVALGRIPGYLEERDVPLDERHVYAGDRTRCPDAGYVFRLPSAGVDTRPLEQKERMLTREAAIDRFLADVDARLGIERTWSWSDLEGARGTIPHSCRRFEADGSCTLPENLLPRHRGTEGAAIDFLVLDGTRPYQAVWDGFRLLANDLDERAYIAVSNADAIRERRGGVRFLRDHVVGTRRYRPVRFDEGIAIIQRNGT